MFEWDNIPQCLRQEVRWCLWRYEDRGGNKPTKVPYMPSGRKAKSNDPFTWSNLGACRAALRNGDYCGVGFFTGNGWGGIDLDNCIDTETGEVSEYAAEMVRACRSYTEITPSGKGLRIFVKSTAGRGAKLPHIEVYSRDRFLTVTGQDYGGIKQVQPYDLGGLVDELRPPRQEKRDHTPRRTVREMPADDELIKKACASKTGEAFSRLWQGDTSDYPSDSEADFALACRLAWWAGGDRDRVLSLMEASGLARDKWDTRRGSQTYLEETVDNALARVTTYYRVHTPPQPPAYPYAHRPMWSRL